jgi:hypothetical protein
MQREISLSTQSTGDWASFCRQVCIDAVITQGQPIGGPGNIVEIDESLFGKMRNGKGKIIYSTLLNGFNSHLP